MLVNKKQKQEIQMIKGSQKVVKTQVEVWFAKFDRIICELGAENEWGEKLQNIPSTLLLIESKSK